MASETRFPEIYNIVIDTTDPAGLADFYRQLLGYVWHPKVGPPPPDDDWVVIVEPDTGRRIAFQQVPALPLSTWPDPEVPAQLHFDLRVGTEDELQRHHERAVELGATVLFEQVDNPEEELIRVYADPAGHPFCIFLREDAPA
jgi:hypothetical protein